ncbi:TetR/AcrR family transcriptional regulator [Kutzneria kofuensis]|uniref:AcrR family transcriptional regulator n=1 Tax=Kutzneria kofuensis TaxID=103725 RepID=A0A7W9NGY0_9PSEU|nr:TetR/AcrR family transcriptional regulator [Kutzneria kofuensis]MBB5892029.1 AcrR family transcriptional regulator [Kutzneria kofuensis]
MDGRTLRGAETRKAVLARAVDIASVEGLEGLSIGRLATELGVSKSGVFAHFGSKEELQLHTVKQASRIFYDEVIAPTLSTAPGVDRVYELMSGWLEYSKSRVFPGGCFFAAVSAEFGAKPGRVRDAIAELDRTWLKVITDAIGQAGLKADPEQLAFELNAHVHAANAASLLHGDDSAYKRADHAVRAALGR